MNDQGKSTFALFFGNRGLFPASLQQAAREEVTSVLKAAGHDYLMMDFDATPNGAVESVEDGEKYARFLQENKGKFDGVLLCLPNFGDENGAVAALKEADVPIFVQAYPDDLDKMAPATRRDSFCGKFSIMDVFHQYEIPFTVFKPHTAKPGTPEFAQNLDDFDRVCRVVSGMRNMTIGTIGARTTPFKTVRIDELTLQRHGITVETMDMAELLQRTRSIDLAASAAKDKAEALKNIARWDQVPEKAFHNLVRLGVAMDNVIDEMRLDALAIRCWIEVQRELGVSVCVLLSEINGRGIAGACETDIGSAVTMRALSLASGEVSTCLDWNNNYGDDLNKCILFHCGPVPPQMMAGKGDVVDHALLEAMVGKGCSYGCNVGRLRPTPFTYGNVLTEDGLLQCYLGEARFTEDAVPDEFFGCAGVAEFDDLQDTLMTIGRQGHRHHVNATPGHVIEPLREAIDTYLGYDLTLV